MPNLLTHDGHNWFMHSCWNAYFAHTRKFPPPIIGYVQAYTEFERTARQSTWKNQLLGESALNGNFKYCAPKLRRSCGCPSLVKTPSNPRAPKFSVWYKWLQRHFASLGIQIGPPALNTTPEFRMKLARVNKTVPSPQGGLAPQKKLQAPQIETSVEFLSIFRVSSSPAETQSPPIEVSGDGSKQDRLSGQAAVSHFQVKNAVSSQNGVHVRGVEHNCSLVAQHTAKFHTRKNIMLYDLVRNPLDFSWLCFTYD